MPERAIPIADTISVQSHVEHEGTGYLEVAITDYDSFKALPACPSKDGSMARARGIAIDTSPTTAPTNPSRWDVTRISLRSHHARR